MVPGMPMTRNGRRGKCWRNASPIRRAPQNEPSPPITMRLSTRIW